MLRRRVVVLLLSVFGFVGLVLIPSYGGATPTGLPGDNSQGNGPSQPRCDPQPDHGNGPPLGKGAKICASP